MTFCRRLAAWALAAWCAGAAPAALAEDPSALFGSPVTANAQFKAPFLTGDFDGDGRPDEVYLVTILPASAQATLAPGVAVLPRVLGTTPLGAHGARLALAIVQDGGRRKFLLTGYEGEDGGGYFDTPIWTASPPPIAVAARGSKAFRDFQRQAKGITDDILVLSTEAGIDTALYWNGRTYVLFAPRDEP